MVRPQGQRRVRLRDHYQRVLEEIVEDHEVPSAVRPDHIVPANAGWVDVVAHTEWYVGGPGDNRPHYRYRRYREVLEAIEPGNGRVSHVDLGCGAGLFSWVFLDWVTEHGVEFDCVVLYAYDHNRAMLQLAAEIRQRLLDVVPNYPPLNYSVGIDSLCNKVKRHHHKRTDYVMTLGHVLVQSHTPGAIRRFVQVISCVMELLHRGDRCAVIAVDAQGARAEFAEGLLDSLNDVGIQHDEIRIERSAINDSDRAKIALLTSGRKRRP